MSEQEHICEHDGCTNEGIPCFLPFAGGFNGEPNFWYCHEHMREEGFCPGCGWFWAGTEYFDFRLNGTDYCENCISEFEEPDDPDDKDWFDDYPVYEDIIEGETLTRYIGPGSDVMPEKMGYHPLPDFECPYCDTATIFTDDGVDEEGFPLGTIYCVKCSRRFDQATDVRAVDKPEGE